MILEPNDIELISIKTKSFEDLDREVNSAARTTHVKVVPPSCAHSRDQDVNTFRDHDDHDDDHDDQNDHDESSVRFVTVAKSPNGVCGFHLTRTKWDPYPWVSAVDKFTPAAKTDLRAGDCVLEVNGCDVLGLRITEIAKLVKSSQHQVTLLLWSTNCNTECDAESLCAAPMPRSLQRLSLVVQSVLSLIECPVCLDTITPPAMQCQNGHLLCVTCRIRAESCPVCRDRYYPRPALIAEQIQSAITSAFNLCRNEDKVRQKIFGRHNRQRQMVKTTLECVQHQRQQKQQVHKSLTTDQQQTAKCFNVATTQTMPACVHATEFNRKRDGNVTDKHCKCSTNSMSSNSINGSGNQTTCNKFLTTFLNSKACPMKNLTNGHNNALAAVTTATTIKSCKHFNTCNSTMTSAITQTQLQQCSNEQMVKHKVLSNDSCSALKKTPSTSPPSPPSPPSSSSSSPSTTNTNQLNDFPRNVARNHHLLTRYKLNGSEPCCNTDTKHFPLSPTSESKTPKENAVCLFEAAGHRHADGNRHCPAAFETSYATIPRTLTLKQKRCRCERDALHAREESAPAPVATNFLKSCSSSLTVLNLSSAVSPHNNNNNCWCCSSSKRIRVCGCCCCCCSSHCSCCPRSISTTNCQSSSSPPAS